MCRSLRYSALAASAHRDPLAVLAILAIKDMVVGSVTNRERTPG